MNIHKALVLVGSTTLVFALLRGLIGFGLGNFDPDYNRIVFDNGNDPDFDPIAVGWCLGLRQGMVAGAILGVILLLVMGSKHIRTREGSDNVDGRKKLNAGTRRFLKITGTIIAVIVTPFLLFFALWFASSYGSHRGSARLAAEWRQLLSEFSDPSSAVAANERVWVIHCENDEWTFGLAQGSHGIWRRGGGTVVTKDSNGALHSYRGHVCWPPGSPFRGCSRQDLAAVYQGIVDQGFEVLDCEVPDENNRPNSAVQPTATLSPRH